MTRTKKIITIVASVVLVVAIGVTIAYAAANNPAEPQQPAPAVMTLPEPGAAQDGGKMGLLSASGINLTPEQVDLIMYVMDTGELPDLTAEQIEELRAALSEFIEQRFSGIDTQYFADQFDRALAIMQNDGPDMAGELLAIMQSSAERLLASKLEEGLIPEEYCDILSSALETGRLELTDEQIAGLKEKAGELLAQGLAEGIVDQECYEVLATALETGRLELTDDQTAQLKAKASDILGQGLAEGVITQGLYDILISAIETGSLEYSEELEMELRAIARDLLERGLAEGIITQRLYDMLGTALRDGRLEFDFGFIAETHASIIALLSRCLEEGVISQEQYNDITSFIGDIARQMAMAG